MAEGRTREIRIRIPEELFSFFLPEKAYEHVLRAKKEALLALRSLIDSRIEALEKKEEKEARAKKKIKIE